MLTIFSIDSVLVGATNVRRNVIYRYLYSTAMFGLLIYAVPIAVLAFLNIRVVMEMKRAKKHWETLNRKQQREVTASVMPLVSFNKIEIPLETSGHLNSSDI